MNKKYVVILLFAMITIMFLLMLASFIIGFGFGEYLQNEHVAFLINDTANNDHILKNDYGYFQIYHYDINNKINITETNICNYSYDST